MMNVRSFALLSLLAGCATARDPENVPPAPAPVATTAGSAAPSSVPVATASAPATAADASTLARGSIAGAWVGRAARFDAMSLTLKAKDGRLSGEGLIRSDTSKVSVTLEGSVTGDAVSFTLRVPKSPDLGYYDGAKFTGRFDGEQIAGELVLAGDPSKRPLTFTKDGG